MLLAPGVTKTQTPKTQTPQLKKRFKFVWVFRGNSHISRWDELLGLISVASIKQWKSNIHLVWFIAFALVKQWKRRFETAVDTVLQKRPFLCNSVQQRMCCSLRYTCLELRFLRNLLYVRRVTVSTQPIEINKIYLEKKALWMQNGLQFDTYYSDSVFLFLR